MFPNSSSKATGSAPDVCQTPAPASAPVPAPYPNVAQTSGGSDPAAKALAMNKKVRPPIEIITL